MMKSWSLCCDKGEPIMNYPLSLLLLAVMGLVGMQAHAQAEKEAEYAVPLQVEATCPLGLDRARSMVENFLTNPNLADARQETGTTSLSVDQIQPVSDPDVCQQLGADYSSQNISDYDLAFYKAGNRYFVTLLLKQSDDPDIVTTGLSMIDIYTADLNFIKGYSG